MGDHKQSLHHSHHTAEAEGRPEREQGDDTQSALYEITGSEDPKHQDLDDKELGFKDQEEDIPLEELAEEEFLDAQDLGEAVLELERVLDQDKEDAVPEMRWVWG